MMFTTIVMNHLHQRVHRHRSRGDTSGLAGTHSEYDANKREKATDLRAHRGDVAPWHTPMLETRSERQYCTRGLRERSGYPLFLATEGSHVGHVQ
jgi:hypothetical protein